ncbi:DUF4157 domain-containing protein [Kordia algicida OT-1]|uniref:eCIS core domain-containing protein n=1 Tax=Kordia algicida OT-1 TaxID=391587 RepID=A9E4W3_9FLAO|nr:DUF4157 domain-containing protein [Kordia algicida]EDP95124.1 hypothetical protein KAOT1_06562 [Kordia algicida OT-1]
MKAKKKQDNQEKTNNIIQRKDGNSFVKPKASTNNFTSSSFSKKQNSALPKAVQSNMETSFGQDFSNVSIHTNSQKAVQMNARAYTQGEQVHFALGEFNPNSDKGKNLIGHEFTHVAQQRAGVVKPTKVLQKGVNINDDKNLESEADTFGAKAARGEAVSKYRGAKASTSATMQRKLSIKGTTATKRAKFLAKINDSSKIIYAMDGAGELYQKYMQLIPKNVYDKAMLSAINASQSVVLQLIDSSDRIFIDSVQSGEVDLDDMLAMSTNVFKSWLLHFVIERFAITNYETSKSGLTAASPEFIAAHTKGHEIQEKFLKEMYPTKTVKFLTEGFDESTRTKDAAGNGSVDYIFDFTDVKYVFTQEIKNNVTIENIIGTNVIVAP